MSNGSKTVILISSSELLLKGLAEVLKGSQASAVILLRRSDEIMDYPGITGIVLVLGLTSELERNKSFLRQTLTGAEGIHFITVQLEEYPPAAASPYITIFDSPAIICFKIDEAFNSFTTAPAPDNNTELTRREIEVLRLLAKGYSNKEIADHLFVSTHTVISHRKNISEKTGIKSASGLTMYAILKKIVDVSDINPAELV